MCGSARAVCAAVAPDATMASADAAKVRPVLIGNGTASVPPSLTVHPFHRGGENADRGRPPLFSDSPLYACSSLTDKECAVSLSVPLRRRPSSVSTSASSDSSTVQRGGAFGIKDQTLIGAQSGADSSLCASSIAAFPSASKAVLLEDVSVKNPAVFKKLGGLVSQLRQLSCDVFEENVYDSISKKTGWKLHLLTTVSQDVLLGFISYRIRVNDQCIEIAKLAVNPNCRRLGYGRRLVSAVIRTGRQTRGAVRFIGLSSLKQAVSFYQRLGFRALVTSKDNTTSGVCEDPPLDAMNVQYIGEPDTSPEFYTVPGQVYMEYRIMRRHRSGNP